MHRAAIESIFGLRLGAHDLSFTPCLPSHWPRAELTLRRDGRVLRFILMRATAHEALAATSAAGARLLQPAEMLQWTALPDHACFVMALGASPGHATIGAPARAAPRTALSLHRAG
jgi:cyclic beta-1,2-glucan synthetase